MPPRTEFVMEMANQMTFSNTARCLETRLQENPQCMCAKKTRVERTGVAAGEPTVSSAARRSHSQTVKSNPRPPCTRKREADASRNVPPYLAAVTAAYYTLTTVRQLRQITRDHVELLDLLCVALRTLFEVSAARQKILFELEAMERFLGTELANLARREAERLAAFNTMLNRAVDSHVTTPNWGELPDLPERLGAWGDGTLAERSGEIWSLDLANRHGPALDRWRGTWRTAQRDEGRFLQALRTFDKRVAACRIGCDSFSNLFESQLRVIELGRAMVIARNDAAQAATEVALLVGNGPRTLDPDDLLEFLVHYVFRFVPPGE